MAVTTAHVSEQEYLGTMDHPDCDYLDGELLERKLGEWDQGEFQALTTERIAEFLGFGVSYVGLIDTATRRASIFTPHAETEVDDGLLRAGDVAAPLAELFD